MTHDDYEALIRRIESGDTQAAERLLKEAERRNDPLIRTLALAVTIELHASPVIDVVLQDAGANTIEVVKCIFGLTRIHLRECKALADHPPSVILSETSPREARSALKLLQDAGATATLSREHDSWSALEDAILAIPDEARDAGLRRIIPVLLTQSPQHTAAWICHLPDPLREQTLPHLAHHLKPAHRAVLTEALDSEAAWARDSAATLLAYLGDGNNTHTLARALQSSPSNASRLLALSGLESVCTPEELIAHIDEAIPTTPSRLRGELMEALIRTGTPHAIRALLELSYRSWKLYDRVVEAVRAMGSEAHEAIGEALSSPEAELRLQAVQLLHAETQAPDAVPALVRALQRGEPDERVRFELLDTLIRLDTDAAIPLLPQHLRGPSWRVRQRSAAALRYHQGVHTLDTTTRLLVFIAEEDIEAIIEESNSALPLLMEELRPPPDWNEDAMDEPEGRSSIARALGRIGAPEAIPALIEAFNDPDDRVAHAAVEALLTGFDASSTFAPLMTALRESPAANIRTQAATALGRLENPEAVPALGAGLESEPDRWVRRAAAFALVELNAPDAFDLLTRTYATQPESQSDAISALARLGDTRAFDLFVEALSSPFMDVRQNAARALGELGDGRAVAPLIAAIGRGLGTSMIPEALVALNDAAAVEPLVAAVKEGESSWSVINALGHFGDARAVVPLARELERIIWDASRCWIAAQLAELLASFEDARAVGPLIEGLRNGSRDVVRSSCARALSQLGDPRALEPLFEALGDRDHRVVEAVVFALRAMCNVHGHLPESFDALLTQRQSAQGEAAIGEADGALREAWRALQAG